MVKQKKEPGVQLECKVLEVRDIDVSFPPTLSLDVKELVITSGLCAIYACRS